MDEEKDVLQYDINILETEANVEEFIETATVSGVEDAVDITPLDTEAAQPETIEYITVEEPEEITIEVEGALVATEGVVMPEHTHDIDQINSLPDKLDKLGSPNQLYAQGHGYAEFRPWKDENPKQDDRLYYFVSLVDNNDNNEWIEICNAEENDVYGVIVGNSGFCGKQDPLYDITDEKSYSLSNNRKYAKVCLLGTVRVRFGGEESEYVSLQKGDYVVPDKNGCAILSVDSKENKTNIGFKVISKEAETIGENTVKLVVISLVPQNDNVARVMKNLEKSNQGLGDLQEQISILQGTVDDNITIRGEFDVLKNFIDKEATSNINAAKEASETAQKISQAAIEKMEEMTTTYQDVMTQVGVAQGNAQSALDQIGSHSDNLNILAQHGDKIVEFFTDASEDGVSVGTIAQTQGDVSMIQQTSKDLQNLVCHVDVYSVGRLSPTNELSYEQAQGAMGSYEYIYVPTINHTENSPVYICSKELERDVWYKFTIDSNTYYFVSPDAHTLAKLQFNIKTKELTIDNKTVDLKEYDESKGVPIYLEFVTEKTITFKVSPLDEKTALGNSYIWKQVESSDKFWWTEVKKSVLHYSEGEPTGDYELWYTSSGIEDQDGNLIYNPGTLYRKTKSGWMAVATINDKNARTMSYIDQKADSITSTITNVGNQISTISQEVDKINSIVKDGGQLSEIQQTAKNVRLGTYYSGGGASELEILLSGLRSDAINSESVWVTDVLGMWPSEDKIYYGEEPRWNGTDFVFSEADIVSRDTGTYCAGDADDTYYKLTGSDSDRSYSVYTNGNTAMASINTRVNNTESAIESWTKFESDISKTMASVTQNANADAAELISTVSGIYIYCAETQIRLNLVEKEPFLKADRYTKPPRWDGACFVFSNTGATQDDKGKYCTLDTALDYYELMLDENNEITGYNRYTVKDSPYAFIMQKTDITNNNSSISLVAGGKKVNGGIFVNAINDQETTVLIDADKIGINGLAVFRDYLNDGTTTISGDYIKTGIIASNNYNGPVTYKMYGIRLDSSNNKLIRTNNSNHYIYYTPAVEGKISQVNYYYYADNIVADEDLTGASATSITNSNKKGNYIVSSKDFVLTPNQVEIQGMKFDLNKGTIHSKNLQLDAEGNLSITGKITATSGFIGDNNNGFTIDTSLIITYVKMQQLNKKTYYIKHSGEYYSFTLSDEDWKYYSDIQIYITPLGEIEATLIGNDSNKKLTLSSSHTQPIDATDLNLAKNGWGSGYQYYIGNKQHSLTGRDNDEDKGDPGVFISPYGIGMGHGRFIIPNTGEFMDVAGGKISYIYKWKESDGTVTNDKDKTDPGVWAFSTMNDPYRISFGRIDGIDHFHYSSLLLQHRTMSDASNDARLDLWGDIYAKGHYKYSDYRLKTNIIDSNVDAVRLLKQIKTKSFDWIDRDEHIDVGLIAQQLENIIPHAVTINEDTGLKAIDYAEIVPYLIKAIQELSEIVSPSVQLLSMDEDTYWEDDMAEEEKQQYVKLSRAPIFKNEN